MDFNHRRTPRGTANGGVCRKVAHHQRYDRQRNGIIVFAPVAELGFSGYASGSLWAGMDYISLAWPKELEAVDATLQVVMSVQV
jgi:hypothetical protein